MPDADGGVRAGVLATLVDVVGGAVAIRSVLPDWMATADLTLQVVGPAAGPWVEARATLVRRGRTTLVVEAVVVNVAEDGSDLPGADVPHPVGLGHHDLHHPSGAERHRRRSPLPNSHRCGGCSGAGLTAPVVEALSITVVDAAAGHLSMPAREYAANSFGAVQGGVMALLAEVAGAEAVGAAQGALGAPVVVTDLQVAYLALGRVGPIETRATVLGGGDHGRPRRAPRSS